MKNLRKLNIIITSILLIFTCFSFRVNVSAEETNDKAAFNESVTLDDVTVTVNAPEGVFPEGSHLQVNKVTDNNVDEAVSEIRDQYTNVVETISFDIKVLDKDGNEVQPDDTVKVSFAYKTNTNDNLDTNIYHIDNELNVEQLDVEVVDDTATVETDSFSIYTVEFTYDNKQYVMDGNTSVKLSEILDYVGLAGDIENVTVSNSELVSAEQTDGEWIITSHQPFTSEEWMKVTLDGVEYEILLTDAVTQYGSIPNSNGKAYYEFDSATGELRIRALNGATGPAVVNGNLDRTSSWPWDNLRNQVKKVTFAKGTSGYGVSFAGVANFMFADMPNLEKVDFSGIEVIKANGIARMFSGCTSLKKVDMSNVKTDGNLSNMQNMFNGCTKLEEVILNNKEFVTRDADATSSRDGAKLSGMFSGCENLKLVDMSNITLTAINIYGDLDSPFKLAKIKEIRMNDVKFKNVKYLNFFMADIDTLEKVSMTGNVDVESLEQMDSMFASNEDLKELDISGLGKMPNIMYMNDMLKGDSALEILNMDNMDNSVIGPTNYRHSISEFADKSEATAIGASEFGRDIFGVRNDNYDVPGNFPALKTISAKNSNVWMCRNNRGLPGSEYYIAENDDSVVFFTKTVTEFNSDVAGPVTIASKRDYVDLIIDRDGINNHTFDGVNDIPDRGTNINIKNGDLNSIGSDNYRPGKLAPGVYTITDGEWDQENALMDETYYRISYIGEAPYKVKIGGEEVDLSSGPVHRDGLVIVKSENNTYISTELKNNWPTSGDYSIDTEIEIVYENAAIDVNGKLHDVVLTVNKVTFKDLDRIPTDGNRGPHDGNRYYDTDGGGQYYRTILQATKDQGVLFKNYVMISSPERPWDEVKALSGGSGTDIDFNIKIDKANPDTSFVFYVDDLDVATKQDWVYPKQNDPCYDNLPIKNATYGKGGEGFKFTDGNLSDPQFAPHTGLAYDNGQVITTGSDPNTPWSEFTVTTDAYNGGNYTWTSGIGCTTYVLKNTPKSSLGEIELDLQATKELLGDTLQAGQFEFKLEPDSDITDNKANESGTVTNGADGIIKLMTKKFDNPKVTIRNEDYYPGTNPDGNTHGDGKHNKYVYAYTIEEIPGNETDIKYDNNPHKLRIEVSTPENDAEMAKGIKAEIFVDNILVKTVWTKDTDKTVNEIKFTNKKFVKLKVTNELLGSDKDTDKPFSFKITLEDGTVKEFTLKDGESSEEIVIVAGSKYTITQTDYSSDGYLTKVGDQKVIEVRDTITADTEVTFTNIKKPFIDPPVKKTVSGDKPDSDGLFTFEITGSDDAPMPAGSKGNSKKVTITGADEFEFGNIYFEDPGVYTYTIREINNGVNGYTYDDSVYQIMVEIDEGYNAVKTVTKNGEPYMSDDEVAVFVFDNVYKKDSKPQRKAYVIPKTGIE